MAQYVVRYYQPKCAKESFYRRHFGHYHEDLRFLLSSVSLVAVLIGLSYLVLPLIHITNVPGTPVAAQAQPTTEPITTASNINVPQETRNLQIRGITTPTKVEWPVRGPVTLEFGAADWPYMAVHTGIDIAVRSGTPVVPAMPGTVIYAGTISWGYGTHIIIDNGNGIQTIYAHLSELRVVKGQVVTMGQVIGLSGSSGWATGPHLHFQVNVADKPVNPRIFLGY